jgi:hypothetical protein
MVTFNPNLVDLSLEWPPLTDEEEQILTAHLQATGTNR